MEAAQPTVRDLINAAADLAETIQRMPIDDDSPEDLRDALLQADIVWRIIERLDK